MVRIRMTDSEYRAFTRAAAAEGTTLSELVRRLLSEHIGRR